MADEKDHRNNSNLPQHPMMMQQQQQLQQQQQQAPQQSAAAAARPAAAAVRPGAVRLRTGRRNRSSLLDDDDGDDDENDDDDNNNSRDLHSRLDISSYNNAASQKSSPLHHQSSPFNNTTSSAISSTARSSSSSQQSQSRYMICDMDHIPEEEVGDDDVSDDDSNSNNNLHDRDAEEEKEEITDGDDDDGHRAWMDPPSLLERDASGFSQFSTYSSASTHSRSNVEPLSQSLGGSRPNNYNGNNGNNNNGNGNNNNNNGNSVATAPIATAPATDDSYWWWCCCCGGGSAALRSGAVQLTALLQWHGLRRWRAPAATFVEILSPALFVLVLVAAYHLSDVEYQPAATYSDWRWQFPAVQPNGDVGTGLGDLIIPDSDGHSLWNNTQFWAQLLLGPEAVPIHSNNTDLQTAQDLLAALFEGVGENRRGRDRRGRGRNRNSNNRNRPRPRKQATTTRTRRTLREHFSHAFLHSRRDHHPHQQRREQRRQLQQQNESTTATSTSSSTTTTTATATNVPDEMQDLLAVLDAAHERVRGLFRHPLPVPPLPEYVALSSIVQQLLANYRSITATAYSNDTSDTDTLAALEDRLLRDSRYGRRWGNLLTPLGTLHVAPAGSERVRQLRAYLDGRYPGLVRWLDGPPRRDGENDDDDDENRIRQHVRLRLHDSEAAAVAFVNGAAALAGERTWGLIDLTAWPAPGSNNATTTTDANNATATTTTTAQDGSRSDSEDDDDDEGLPDEPRPFYKIRLNYTTLPSTAERIDPVPTGLNLDFSLYYLSGFLTLQRTLNEFAFAVAGREENAGGVDGGGDGDDENESAIGNSNNNDCYANVLRDHSRIWSMPFPTAEYNQNAFYATVGPVLGLTITMAFLFPVARLIKLIVEEKETRQRELLFVMGLQPWAHWWSWFLSALVTFAVNALLVTWTLSAQVLQYSSFGCLLVWIVLFSTASIGFCFFVAAFFVQSKLAAVTGPILLFATLLPRFLFFESSRYADVPAKRWASLLPATAFALGADVIADYEYAEIGVHSAWQRDDDANGQAFTFQSSIFFLLLDTFLYLILGWYADQVIPRSSGKPLPFYFLLSPRYWLGDLLTGRRSHDTGDDWENGDDDSASASSISSWSTAGIRQFEHEPNLDPTLVPMVEFRHLEKYYRRRKGAEPALADLNLTLYQDQITSLIGHNGAGKSTCLGVLTGMLAPTSGDCFIGGRSIAREPRAARRSVGYCPQENILCDRLSVREHIAFYMQIKGVLASEEEVRRRVVEVGLGDFYYARAGSLSAGSKRKLMLAISFAGDPELLVLDEPTSGMDPASRRNCWECLRLKRPGRVIVLVSHAMSEADLCSDRIAILKDGVLQASGSPSFLKKRFGLGYNLTLVISPERRRGGRVAESQRTFDSSELQSKIRRVTEFLQDKIPEAELVRVLGTEVVYRVPNGFEDRLPIALSTLDLQSRSLGIGAFGIENSSLEEVVLYLSEEQSLDDEIPHDITAMSTNDEGSCSTMTGNVVIEPSPACFLEPKQSQSQISVLESVTWTEQVGLLYRKRFTIQKRDLKGFLFSVVVPTLVVALVLLILTVDLSLSGPSIEMSPTALGIKDTDILIGGGAAFRNRLTTKRDIAQRVDKLRTALEPLYENTHLHHAESIRSSDAMSDYLLESIANYDGNDRYGSFVLEDVLKFNIAVDWPFYEGDFQRLLNNSLRVFAETEIDIANERVEDLIGNFPGIDVGSYLWIGNYIIQTMQNRVANSSVSTESVLRRAGYPKSESNYSFSFDVDASILHNSSSTHAVAIFDKALFDALFGLCIDDGKSAGPANKNRVLVSSVNHPLPLSTQQTIEVKVLLSVLAGMFVLIPFCYVPGAFVVVLVKELTVKSKFLQVASGAKESAFWVSGYLWDVTLYSVLVTLVMCVMLGYRSAEVFVGNASSFFCTATLFWGYGLSIMPFSYLIARRFRNPSSAQLAVITIIFVTGFVAVNAYYIMNSIPKTQNLARILRKIFRLWPAFNLGDGLVAITGAFWERNVLGMESNPFDWDIAGFPLVLLFVLSIPYFGLVLILEGTFQTLQHTVASEWEKFILDWYDVKKTKDGMLIQDDGLNDSSSQDSDVNREKKLVSKNFPKLVHSSPVIFNNTWKVYLPPNSGLFALFFVPIFRSLHSLGRRCCNAMCLREATGAERQEERRSLLPTRALRGLTFAVRKGEAFVLLGVNGSGKSTALNLLSGEIQPTSGAVFVAGYDVNSPSGIAAARKKIGICPQSDPLLERMTGRETLRMFARLRGMPKTMIDTQVESLLELLMLSPYADKNTEEYSGGNRRKLSLGIALVGDPDILLIDESCSGVDPASQRKIWTLIARIAKDRSVLLTSHSMDETQALSSRTAIMSGGKLLCLGSVQHLKTKYLDSYTIDIFLFAGASTDHVDLVVHEVLERTLPGSVLVERQGRFLRFEVSNTTRSRLGPMFRSLEDLKNSKRFGGTYTRRRLVEEYSIRQCDLEQVFLKLVKRESEESRKKSKSESQQSPTEQPSRRTPDLTVPMASDDSTAQSEPSPTNS